MIRAVLKLDCNGNFTGFTVKGHSGSAPKGKDIICAAVSGIVQTALIGLDEVAGIKNTYTVDDGLVICELPKDVDKKDLEKATVILQTMQLGLLSIADQFPDFVLVK